MKGVSTYQPKAGGSGGYYNNGQSIPAKKNSKIGGLELGGGILSVAIAIVILGIYLFVFLISAVFESNMDSTGYWVSFFLFSTAGVWLIFAGSKRLSLSSRYKKYMSYLGRQTITLVDLAGATGQEPQKVLDDLCLMQHRNFWRATTVMEDFIVIQPFATTQTMKILADQKMCFADGKRHLGIPYIVVLLILIGLAVVLPLPSSVVIWMLIAAAVSYPVYKVADKFSPAYKGVVYRKQPERKVVLVDNQTANQVTGLAKDLIVQAQGSLRELNELKLNISEISVYDSILDLSASTQQIINLLESNPEKASNCRQIVTYTLPTTVKLLKTYDDMSKQAVQGPNITQSMTQIREMSSKVAASFCQELDALYQDQSLDISVDIEVMESILKNSNHNSSVGDVVEESKGIPSSQINLQL